LGDIENIDFKNVQIKKIWRIVATKIWRDGQYNTFNLFTVILCNVQGVSKRALQLWKLI
jgi:hypothetical protein